MTNTKTANAILAAYHKVSDDEIDALHNPFSSRPVIRTRTNPYTGADLAVLDASWWDNETKQRWYSACLTHDITAAQPTRQAAYDDLASPETWCSECAAEIDDDTDVSHAIEHVATVITPTDAALAEVAATLADTLMSHAHVDA